jgi:hypothetical protein
VRSHPWHVLALAVLMCERGTAALKQVGLCTHRDAAGIPVCGPRHVDGRALNGVGAGAACASCCWWPSHSLGQLCLQQMHKQAREDAWSWPATPVVRPISPS